MLQSFVDTLRAYSLRLFAAPPAARSEDPAPAPAYGADQAVRLREARALLQQASHLAHYHQPALAHEIRRFLEATTAAPPAAVRPAAARRNLA